MKKELVMANSAVKPLGDKSDRIRPGKVPHKSNLTDSLTARNVAVCGSTAVNLASFTVPTGGLRKKFDQSIPLDDRPKPQSSCSPSDLFLG